MSRADFSERQLRRTEGLLRTAAGSSMSPFFSLSREKRARTSLSEALPTAMRSLVKARYIRLEGRGRYYGYVHGYVVSLCAVGAGDEEVRNAWGGAARSLSGSCLLYTSDAADE